MIMVHYLQYIMIRIVAFFFGVMPISFSIWCGRRAGDIGFLFMARRRNVAIENIRKAFGNTRSEAEIRDIARASFQNTAVSAVEFFLIKRIKANLDKHVTLVGAEHLEQGFEQGKGVVLAMSHLGSWEYLAFLNCSYGRDWTVIVKSLRNPYLNGYVSRIRCLTTVKPLAKERSIRPILRGLRSNHGIALLIDQWAGAEGIWVDLFGVKTSTTSVPARLVKQTDSALLFGYCLRKSLGKYEIHILPELQLDLEDEHWEKTITEKLNGLFEEQVRKNPKQWLWGHRRWKNKPSEIRAL